MAADPCESEPPPSDHLVYGGAVYDVADVAYVGEIDAATGAELLEVWVTRRGEGHGEPE